MSNEKSLRHVTVPSPCLADWDQMTGNDQIRFCEHCSLHVHHLSKLTYSRAARLVERSQGRLCVRYYRGAEGAPLTKPAANTLHKIGRRVSRLAAGAFSASMSLSAAVAQGQSPVQSISALSSSTKPDTPSLAASITGTITDPNGAVIAGASIAVFSAGSQSSMYTSTNDEGIFRIDGLAGGPYSIRVTAPGFAAKETDGVFVQDNAETKFDVSLSVAGIEANVDTQTNQIVELGGAVAYVAPRDPLIKAASEDNLLEVEQLLPGRNVNLRDTQSATTALEHAVRNGNREMVQLLLRAGADVNAEDPGGRTVLMMIGEEATSDLVWDLVNAGARVDHKDHEGNTPLIEAAGINNISVLTTLLDSGAQVTEKNDDGETPLMMAAAAGLVNNVRTLVLAGADINQRDERGKSALSLAVENNQSAVIRFMRSQGALEAVAQVEPEN